MQLLRVGKYCKIKSRTTGVDVVFLIVEFRFWERNRLFLILCICLLFLRPVFEVFFLFLFAFQMEFCSARIKCCKVQTANCSSLDYPSLFMFNVVISSFKLGAHVKKNQKLSNEANTDRQTDIASQSIEIAHEYVELCVLI